MPFTIPIHIPANIPERKHSGNGKPLAARPADNTPERATTPPTDRSIPPHIITKVAPHEVIIRVLICCNTLLIFGAVKKYSDSIDKTKHIARKMNIIINL
jgi:hypothetical protein